MKYKRKAVKIKHVNVHPVINATVRIQFIKIESVLTSYSNSLENSNKINRFYFQGKEM